VASGLRAQSVTLRPAGDLSSLVGMPLDVPMVADWTARADKLGSFALTLRWNPTVLRFESGANGTFGTIVGNTDSAAQGVLRLSGANPNGVNGLMTLGVGRFTPLDTVGTTLQLQVTELYATAPTFANLTGSAIAQNALYCAGRGLWGDADLDGSVDSRDALLALSSAVGLDVSAFPQIGLADVDTSGVVDARDALVILSYAVGMNVSGFRINTLALGSCGTAVQTSYAILPGSDTLLQNQALHLGLQATSTLGAVRTLNDVFWRSTAPTVLAVTQDGRAFGVGAGSATLVGKSGARDSAVVTMTVVARRSHHLVDAAATGATNRIGSAALPFASLQEAAGVTAEGDTVFVRPGHYVDPGSFNQGVVILGQPGGSGVLLSTGVSTAISFNNGHRAEVHNVAIDNTHLGIEASGLDTLVVDSLTYTAAAGTCVAEAVGSSDIRQLVVRRSTLTGDGPSGCTTGIDAFGVVQNLTVDGVLFSDFGNNAVSAPLADSVMIRASAFHDIGSAAVSVGAATCCGGGRLPVPASLALVFDANHVVRTASQAISATRLRSARLSHSSVDGTGSPSAPVSLSGLGTAGSAARVIGDTLVGSRTVGTGADWLDAAALDSVVVDSVEATGYDGYITNVAAVRVTRSRVQVLTSGAGIYYAPTTAGSLTVDSVTVTGDANCGRCGYGISTSNARVAASHFTVSDVAYGINVGDSSVTVTNSAFANVNYGLNASSCCSRPPAVLRGLQVTNATYGVNTINYALTADSLMLSSGSYGVQAGNLGADTVRNSTFADFRYPISLTGDTLVATGNTLLRPGFDGIQTYGQNLAGDISHVINNTITCDAVGATSSYAVWSASANAIVAGNTVSGCNSSVYIANIGPGLTAVVRGNLITAPAAATDAAIHVASGNLTTVAGNQITRGGHSGAIWLAGNVSVPLGRARVDSNTILHVADRAIWADYTDTLTARGNLIDTVTYSGYYTSGPVGIGLANGALLDSLERNTIRHAARGVEISISGMAAALDSNAISATDTAAVWVDAGQVALTGNHIADNSRYGLNIVGASAAIHQVHGNAFVSDAQYGIATSSDSVNAQGNWWGLVSGPRTGAGSDSTIGRVDVTNFLTTDPSPSLPPLAPPVRIVALAPAPAGAGLPVRRYVAPAQTASPAPAPVTTNARELTLASRMAAVTGDSRVARALLQRAARLRAQLQEDAARSQERAQRAAAERERQRQAEAAQAARIAARKGRPGS
jgi:hypothetical protein